MVQVSQVQSVDHGRLEKDVPPTDLLLGPPARNQEAGRTEAAQDEDDREDAREHDPDCMGLLCHKHHKEFDSKPPILMRY